MLGAAQALQQNASSSPVMPHVAGLQPLYMMGCNPRQGEVTMIAGRSGSMKSTFALWLVEEWGLDTLYLSADMSGFQASVKLAAHMTKKTVNEVEEGMRNGDADYYLGKLRESKIRFSFRSPIRWTTVFDEINAYVLLYNKYPKVIVVDNLMDVEESEADYAALTLAMQILSDLSRATGASILVLHHASDKSWEADSRPYRPPSRKEIKYGMSEKPELSLGVALNNETLDFNIAILKQRMGHQDPTANTFATLQVDPERNLFGPPGTLDSLIEGDNDGED